MINRDSAHAENVDLTKDNAHLNFNESGKRIKALITGWRVISRARAELHGHFIAMEVFHKYIDLLCPHNERAIVANKYDRLAEDIADMAKRIRSYGAE